MTHLQDPVRRKSPPSFESLKWSCSPRSRPASATVCRKVDNGWKQTVPLEQRVRMSLFIRMLGNGPSSVFDSLLITCSDSLTQEIKILPYLEPCVDNGMNEVLRLPWPEVLHH